MPLAALLVAVGLGCAFVAYRQKEQRQVADLRAVLDGYATSTGPVQQTDDLRAALARTGRLAERALSDTGLLARVRAQLLRSDWTLTPGEFLAVSAGALLLGIVVGVLSENVGLGLLLGLVGAVTPYALVSRSVSRRRAAFEDQLPDVLDLLSASLEAGAGIAAALELVVAEADEPAASEFGRVLAATRLGATLLEGLEEMAERLDSRDLVYTVQAIAVQQRTGGRLAEVLRNVAEFMRARFELKRELSALTAEGRISAYLLGGLPIALGLLISVISPGYLTPLFTTGPGLAMVCGASVLMLISFGMMKKIITIEV
ncbi:MAG: Bacterial type secretion system protein domain protein [Frankiales bacterium]|nr:Bacterial type secretion system protein domain protein [Frankiales bacterium]